MCRGTSPAPPWPWRRWSPTHKTATSPTGSSPIWPISRASWPSRPWCSTRPNRGRGGGRHGARTCRALTHQPRPDPVPQFHGFEATDLVGPEALAHLVAGIHAGVGTQSGIHELVRTPDGIVVASEVGGDGNVLWSHHPIDEFPGPFGILPTHGNRKIIVPERPSFAWNHEHGGLELFPGAEGATVPLVMHYHFPACMRSMV